MKPSESQPFRRQIESERAVIMLPLNVVMAAHIRGPLEQANLAAALERLRVRHPLLAVRVELNDDGTAFFTTEGVPAIPVHVELKASEEQWISRVEQEIRTPFKMETGPLFRCLLIQSKEGSKLILCGHHAVCDGMSLVYLLRDVLEQLTKPSETEPLLPPTIRFDTVTTPPAINPVARALIRLMNHVWRKKKLRFDFGLMAQMHQRYWQRNSTAIRHNILNYSVR
ncbi:condensation domain-containing protein [Planctomycetota bacterium]